MIDKKELLLLATVATLVLGLCGCGSSDGPPETVVPDPVALDDERRNRLLKDNGPIIEASVFDNVVYGTGWERVRYGWDGSELSFDIHETRDFFPPLVSLSSRTDAVQSSNPPALSGNNIQGRKREEFQISQSAGSKDTIGTIGVDYASATDYFVYGYWLTVDHAASGPAAVDTGAFSSAFVAIASMPAGGSAKYEGKRQASGLHTVTYSGVDPDGPGEKTSFAGSKDEFRIAHFVGDVVLTVDFNTGDVSGWISNICYPDPERSASGPVPNPGGGRAFEVELGSASINASGRFSGSAPTATTADWSSTRPEIVDSDGHWEGQFSSRPVSEFNSEPRAAAGTFSTRYRFEEGTVGTYLGTFSAGHCSNPSC